MPLSSLEQPLTCSPHMNAQHAPKFPWLVLENLRHFYDVWQLCMLVNECLRSLLRIEERTNH